MIRGARTRLIGSRSRRRNAERPLELMSEIAVAADPDCGFYFFDGEFVADQKLARALQSVLLQIDAGRDADFRLELMTQTRGRQTGHLGHVSQREVLAWFFLDQRNYPLNSSIHEFAGCLFPEGMP